MNSIEVFTVSLILMLNAPKVHDMYTVNTCPNNLEQVQNASKRIGCGSDEFRRPQYMCIPDNGKQKLVEFCYNGIMTIKEAGNCLKVNTEDGNLSLENCTDFVSGCPKEPFWNNDFYNSQPSCPPVSDVGDMVTSGWMFFLYLIVIIITTIVIVCGVLWMKKENDNRGSLGDFPVLPETGSIPIKKRDELPEYKLRMPATSEEHKTLLWNPGLECTSTECIDKRPEFKGNGGRLTALPVTSNETETMSFEQNQKVTEHELRIQKLEKQQNELREKIEELEKK